MFTGIISLMDKSGLLRQYLKQNYFAIPARIVLLIPYHSLLNVGSILYAWTPLLLNSQIVLNIYHNHRPIFWWHGVYQWSGIASPFSILKWFFKLDCGILYKENELNCNTVQYLILVFNKGLYEFLKSQKNSRLKIVRQIYNRTLFNSHLHCELYKHIWRHLFNKMVKLIKIHLAMQQMVMFDNIFGLYIYLWEHCQNETN